MNVKRPKFDRTKWKERKEDERLQEKYGENWRVVKRSMQNKFKTKEKK